MQKILLLEDDLNLNRGIALLLSREGYEVRQVYTIKEAKEAFQKGDYALVISDITLPDGTGLDFGRMVQDWILEGWYVQVEIHILSILRLWIRK